MSEVFDLHIHTTRGSRDSALEPLNLVEEMLRMGVRGGLLTEHDGWPRHEFETFAQHNDILLVNALEVYTEMGHVIALGLDGYQSGIHKAQNLRRVVDSVGGFLILAHPFRFLFDPHGVRTRNILFPDPMAVPDTEDQAAEHVVFSLVDEVEAVNAACTKRENRFAGNVARLRGRPGTGGSDAHSVHGLFRGATVFDGHIRNERDLLDALRSGDYRPAERSQNGEYLSGAALKCSQQIKVEVRRGVAPLWQMERRDGLCDDADVHL
jgi:predicted metal-dependent phosphoesterase TrpH